MFTNDLGLLYQGINRYHSNSYISHKKPRFAKLTIEQQPQNQQPARRRVRGENVIRHLKISGFYQVVIAIEESDLVYGLT